MMRRLGILHGWTAGVLLFAGCVGAAMAGSIFDDDFKPPPASPTPGPADAPGVPTPPSPGAPTAPSPPVPAPAAPAPTPAFSPRIKATSVPSKSIARPAPLPRSRDIAAAEKIVHDAYADVWSVTATQDQRVLGTIFQQEEQANPHEPAMQYVLLRDALTRFESACDVARGVQTVEQMGRLFDFDWQAREAQLIANTSHDGMVAKDYGVELALRLSEMALESDRFDVASDAAAAGVSLAHWTNNNDLNDLASQRATFLAAAAEQATKLAPQLAKLKANTADLATRFALGKFYCLSCGQWQRGLPLLALRRDMRIGKLASREVAATSVATTAPTTAPMTATTTASTTSSTSPAEWAAIAREWVELATKETGLAKDQMQEHAQHLYQRALPKLTGLARVAASKRLSDLCMADAAHGVICEVFRGRYFTERMQARLDSYVDNSWNRSFGPMPEVNRRYFSLKWTGWLKAPSPGNYTIDVRCDDGARVWIDNTLVIDCWAGPIKSEGYRREVELGDDPVSIRVEYYQVDGPAYMGLGWIPPGLTKTVLLPNSALYHERIDMEQAFYRPITADASGKVTLEASRADVHGSELFFADTPQRQTTLAHWVQDSDWASWDFTAPPGDYQIIVETAVEPGNNGGDYVVRVGDASLPGTAADTGGWMKFAPATLGTVHLTGTNQTLSVKCPKLTKGALMNLGRVILQPVKGK